MQATGYFFRVCRFSEGPSVKRCSNLRVTVKPETDFFSFFNAKCQTVLKIEGVTRGPEVDLETPLRCFFFFSRTYTAPRRETICEGPYIQELAGIN